MPKPKPKKPPAIAPQVVIELSRIDHEIHTMWALYRRWIKRPPNGNTDPADRTNPVEVLKAIDDLLDQRHKIAPRILGELVDDRDRADATEWGSANVDLEDIT